MSQEIFWIEIALSKEKGKYYDHLNFHTISVGSNIPCYMTRSSKWNHGECGVAALLGVTSLTGVPLTTVEIWAGKVPSISGTGASLERPKSATFATNLESRRILLALMSRWNIGGFASVCRYRIPFAAPSAIWTLWPKLRGLSVLAVKMLSLIIYGLHQIQAKKNAH